MKTFQEYLLNLQSQGYTTVMSVCANISIEDLEDVGIFKLGHQKKLMLAIRKINGILRRRKAIGRREAVKPKSEHFSTFHHSQPARHGSLSDRPASSGSARPHPSSSARSQKPDARGVLPPLYHIPTPSPPPYPALDELEQELLKVRPLVKLERLEGGQNETSGSKDSDGQESKQGENNNELVPR